MRDTSYVTVLSLAPRRSGEPSQPDYDPSCCLRPVVVGSTSEGQLIFGATSCLLGYGPVTRSHPKDGLVDGLQRLGFPPPCHPSYKALALTLAGLTPAERVRLRWTHVGSKAGAVSTGTGSCCLPEAFTIFPVPQSVPWPRFQLPPHRTQHADFPHYALLFAFIPRVMGPIEPGALSAVAAWDETRGNARTGPACRTATAYSTSSSRTPYAAEPASSAA